MLEIIQEIGSYAGLAAVVGLAVLSALYFSQARDVKRLREWAGRAPERAAEQPAAPRVVATPKPRPAAAKPGAQPAGAAAKPAGAQPKPGAAPTPVPTPAPAQAAAAGATPATARPAAATPAAQSRQGAPQPVPAGATAAAQGAPAAGGATAAPDREQSGQAQEEAAPAETAVESAEEKGGAPGATEKPEAPAKEEMGAEEKAEAAAEKAEVPAGADQLDSERESPPAPAPPAAPKPGGVPGVPAPAAAGRRPPGRAPSRFPSRRPASAPAPSQTAILPPYEELQRQPWHRRLLASPRYLVLVVAGVLILGGGAAFGVVQLTGEDEGQPGREGASGGEERGEQREPSRPAPVNPASVTVSVLNGTTVPGLAAQIGDRVEAQGFQLGNVTNSSDQQRAESVVLYASGAEREAMAVGRRLRLSQREPIDPESQALGGDATVVVIAGSDLTQ